MGELDMASQAMIQMPGVMRCCLGSIGGDYVGDKEDDNWQVFENPQEGDTDTCEYCGREFTLVDNVWRPTEQVDA